MSRRRGSLYFTCVLRCCGAYFSLDAAPFTAVYSGSLPTPPLFLTFVHFLVKNTLDFAANQAVFSKKFGGFQSKLWVAIRIDLEIRQVGRLGADVKHRA